LESEGFKGLETCDWESIADVSAKALEGILIEMMPNVWMKNYISMI
jgi:hypothetical protein